MSNFNQIGFSVHSEEDYEDLCLTHADKASVEQETPLGIYLGWQENENFGPELWIQAEGEALISMHPYFRGKSEMKVGAVDVIDQGKLTPLDAPLFTWFNPEEGNPDSGETIENFNNCSKYAAGDVYFTHRLTAPEHSVVRFYFSH